MNPAHALKESVWRNLGASGAAIDRLMQYSERSFCLPPETEAVELPLADEPCVDLWRTYAHDMEQAPGPDVWSRFFVQFRFPIAEGISALPEYQRATRLGARFQEDAGRPCAVRFENPQGIRLLVHATPAGSIPVWLAAERSDFVSLLRLFLYRNEPVAVPEAIGAYMIAGFRNWHRYYSMPLQNQSSFITDRFIVLSSGPYSGVPAAEMSTSEEGWRTLSVRIRLEHECAHYFTRRLFGSMANNIHDEILADYSGIVAATGSYRADWALRFLGLESSGMVLPGARLERYVPNGFSEADADCLRRLTLRAIANLERFDGGLAWQYRTGRVPVVIWALAALPLEALASDHGERLLNEQFQRILGRCRLNSGPGQTGSN